MKICLDIQPALGQRAGVGRYTRSLAEHLPEQCGGDSIMMFYFDFKRHGLSFSVEGAEQKSIHWCPGRLMQKSWNIIGFPPFDMIAGRADIYHFPNFIIPPMRRGRSVVTIHDASFLAFPEFAESRNLEWLTRRIHDTVRRADAIITDSAFSADEIALRLRADRSRIFPVHLGLSAHFAPAPKDAIDRLRVAAGLDRPYLLAVGTIEPRKNIEFLVSVFEHATGFDGHLVLAGMKGWKCSSIFKRIQESPRASDIRYIEFVQDADLPALYSGAELFLFPSLYEGFGLPPLEAMACGTPVISSSAASLPEVLGDAALLLPLDSPQEWASEIGRLLGAGEDRSRLSREGLAQASRYTWRETARRTWEVYRRAAS